MRVGSCFLLGLLAACSGSGSMSGRGLLPPISKGAVIAPPPTALNAAFLRSLPRATFSVAQAVSRIQPPANLFRAVPPSHGPRPPGSTVGQNDSETLGTLINGGGSYTGIYAQQTAYTAAQFPLPYPPGDMGTEVLFSPLTLPPNGGCFSPATLALNAGSQPATYFAVTDYCGTPRVIAATPIDNAFENTYVHAASDGLPIYATLVVTLDPVPSAKSTWYILLYNFASASWTIVSQDTGSSGLVSGHSLFHSAYLPGKCPDALPPVAAENLSLYSAKSSTFEPVTPTMVGTTSIGLGPNASTSCFNADSSGPASSTFTMVSPNSYWTVRSGAANYTNITLALKGPLVMGTSANIPLSVVATDSKGNPVNGPYTPPITLINSDTSGRTSLSTNIVGSSNTTVTLNYNGHGVLAKLAAAGGSAAATLDFFSYLPKDILLGVPSQTPQNILGRIAFGSDGNLWSANNMSNAAGVDRGTLAGQWSTFLDPNGNHWRENDTIAKGSDGNIWIDFHDSFTEHQGLIRVTPGGQLTNFEFGGNMPDSIPTSMALGNDGAIWFSLFNSSVGSPGIGIARVDMSGNITQIASTPASGTPTNLIVGPDHNFWFSFPGPYVARMTPSGTITQYTLPVTGNGDGLRFVVGPDGYFWAPYAYGQNVLLKFATNGTLVSTTPLTYNTPWVPFTPSVLLSSFAKDANGNIYSSDEGANAVIRITPSGHVSEYPIYSARFNIVQDAGITIATGPDGKIYLEDEATVDVQQDQTGGIVRIDPALW